MKKIMIVSFLLLVLVLCAGCSQMADETEEINPAPTQSAALQSLSPTESIAVETPAPTPATITVSSEQMTLHFVYGERTGVYSGEILDGLPHGTGTFVTQNEDGLSWTYEGAWENGHMNGEGITVWDDGYKQTGTYANDSLNGQGAEYQDDILLYEGNYLNGIYQGQGKLLNCVGKTIYEGDFSKGYMNETSEARETRLATFMQQCQAIDFEEYANNNQAYIGQDILLTGKLFDVWLYEGEEYYGDFLVYEQDNTNNIVSVVYNYSVNETAFQEETMVNIWGTISGMYTYTTEDGRELTVPEIEAWNILQYEP